jgi:hypothetical protein
MEIKLSTEYGTHSVPNWPLLSWVALIRFISNLAAKFYILEQLQEQLFHMFQILLDPYVVYSYIFVWRMVWACQTNYCCYPIILRL